MHVGCLTLVVSSKNSSSKAHKSHLNRISPNFCTVALECNMLIQLTARSIASLIHSSCITGGYVGLQVVAYIYMWLLVVNTYSHIGVVCNLDKETLPLPAPFCNIWGSVQKKIDTFHLPNHEQAKCHEKYNPDESCCTTL